MLAAVAALGLAACSNGQQRRRYGGGGSTSTSSGSGGAAAAVATADVGDLGTVLVDGTGRTLYLFESDTGTDQHLHGGLRRHLARTADHRPATARGRAQSSGMLGTTTRDDGTTQVTYDGHPLVPV